MFINKIMVDNTHTISFASSIEVFHILEPIYQAIQKVLVKWGFTKEHDHSFTHASRKTVRFDSHEDEYWEPHPHAMVNQYPHKQQELMFIITIIKLFKEEVETSEVETLLTAYKIV